MNEGENSGMPSNPIFPSPKNPDSPDGAPTQNDQTAQANFGGASVAGALGNLSDNDPTQPDAIISSEPSRGVNMPASAPASSRSRFGLSRRFNKQAQQPIRSNAFANAPEFFNSAVDEVVIADAAAAASKKKVKKFILIAIVALLVIAAAVAGVMLLRQSSKPNANKVRVAFNRYANYILSGEEKDSDIGEFCSSCRYTIMDKYLEIDDNYNKRFLELYRTFEKEYNAAAENGLYGKDGLTAYSEIVTDVYSSFTMNKYIDDSEAIYQLYYEKGEDAAHSEIESIKSKINSVKESYYATLSEQYLEENLNFYKQAKKFECEDEKSECPTMTAEQSNELDELQQNVTKYTDELDELTTNQRIGILRNLFSISGVVYEK